MVGFVVGLGAGFVGFGVGLVVGVGFGVGLVVGVGFGVGVTSGVGASGSGQSSTEGSPSWPPPVRVSQAST